MSVMPHDEPECAKVGLPTVEVTIEARAKDLGDGFVVRRVLPSIARRAVGPFVFVDHMGPVQMAAGVGLDVRPHPHINLATVTYLFDGEILHADSLGTELPIRPGAVNWMTAGRGIVHSERSTAEGRKSGAHVHGMQLWVALPTEHEQVDPSFQHHPADTIPAVERPGAELRIIAGSAYGATSPVQVLSPLFYVDAKLAAGANLTLPDEYHGRAVYVVSGAVSSHGKVYKEASMLVFRSGAPACIQALEASRVLLLGGEPLDGERHIWWNFVSSSKARIEQAKEDWRSGRFPQMRNGDTEFIPLPAY